MAPDPVAVLLQIVAAVGVCAKEEIVDEWLQRRVTGYKYLQNTGAKLCSLLSYSEPSTGLTN